MQLSNLQTKARFLTNTTSTDYSDTNLNRSLNDYYHQLFVLIMKTMGEWEVNGDYATTNLVASQDEYPLDSTYLTLKRVEINTTGNTNSWTIAPIIDLKEIKTAISNTESRVYPCIELFDNSIFVRPTPDTNVTAGLKIWFTKEFTELSGSTDEPITPEFTHLYLIHGAGLDWAVSKGMNDKATTFSQLLLGDVKQIQDYYSRRNLDRPFKLNRAYTSYK